MDGFGNQLLMDDANLPNLLSSVPYLGYNDTLGLYAATRAFVLTPQRHDPILCRLLPELCVGNPNYYVGIEASGLGSRHTSHGLRIIHKGPECKERCVWPLGLIMEAITTSPPPPSPSPSRFGPRGGDGEQRKRDILCTLLQTDDGTGFMHEGFSADNASIYNRDWFGWANSLFSMWLLQSDSFTGTGSGGGSGEGGGGGGWWLHGGGPGLVRFFSSTRQSVI